MYSALAENLTDVTSFLHLKGPKIDNLVFRLHYVVRFVYQFKTLLDIAEIPGKSDIAEYTREI